MIKNLKIHILSGFNSMNIQCILPRIDHNLSHTPQISELEIDPNVNSSTFDYGNNSQQVDGGAKNLIDNNDKRSAISNEVIKALCQQLLKEEKTKVKEIIASTIG
jgi:hypothetical protein